MIIDKKTLQDLSIFHQEGGIYELLNQCISNGGSQLLKDHLHQPPQGRDEILAFQKVVSYWMLHQEVWDDSVKNGTLVMVEKFFSSYETIIPKPSVISLYLDKLIATIFPRNEQNLIKFSIEQVIIFVKGLHNIYELHQSYEQPSLLSTLWNELHAVFQNKWIQEIIHLNDHPDYKTIITLAYHTRKELSSTIKKMIQIWNRLDCYRGLGIACVKNKWTIPNLLPQEDVIIDIKGLYHPLLHNPISYDISLGSNHQNFLFLTGANMSGKSTLMRAIGITSYLAHLGVGVPASKCAISYLNAIITNMQIEDNIFTGESYFFAEVQRMKNTAEQLSKQPYNLVLMDELFKGTNVHDAYECTETVMKALLNSKNNIMCLSTHLYEVGKEFIDHASIQFQYCNTNINEDGKYTFTYELKKGISNDRIGYLVLKKEGVVDILNTI